jgi:hypothetical protein
MIARFEPSSLTLIDYTLFKGRTNRRRDGSSALTQLGKGLEQTFWSLFYYLLFRVSTEYTVIACTS